MKRYAYLLFIFVRQSFSTTSAEPLDFWTYLAGKLIRMGLFFVFIFSLFRLTPNLAGYDFASAMLIFATYNIVDVITQVFFFRGFYQLQTLIRLGRFDPILTYPVSPLFYIAFRSFDLIDLATLVPVFVLLWWAVTHIAIAITFVHTLFYLLLLLNGLLLTLSFCILFGSLTFWTDELEHVWFFYRSTMRSGRYPIQIFRQPIRFVFTWIIPIGLVITFPVQAFLGILSWQFMVGAFCFSIFFFYCTLRVWRYAIRHYSSVSS